MQVVRNRHVFHCTAINRVAQAWASPPLASLGAAAAEVGGPLGSVLDPCIPPTGVRAYPGDILRKPFGTGSHRATRAPSPAARRQGEGRAGSPQAESDLVLAGVYSCVDMALAESDMPTRQAGRQAGR